jgi:hypothetical protein
MPTDNSVDAHPTKSFFITMLTKDIELSSAILDLVDNCLDGALALRPGRNFKGLWIRIEANPTGFKISDNCGGIPIDVAKKYAFRFGRPDGMTPTVHSVGQFGVGMKRALFKLGSKFVVESRTKTTSFTLDVDVDQWKRKQEWTFSFQQALVGLDLPEDERGTTIKVAPLHESVKEDFRLENFLNGLALEIMRKHQLTIESGIGITLNGVPIQVNPLTLLGSDELLPAKYEEAINVKDGIVNVKIYAGISDPKPELTGWYIYCNGRMILEADHTAATGWGEKGEPSIPRYHNQFDRFRGFVFFDSDQAALLPWNTTKTGVDKDSPVFRYVKLKMSNLARQVITFLNELDKENQLAETDVKPLHDTVSGARASSVAQVQTSSSFTWPIQTNPIPLASKPGYIQYHKPTEKIENVKKVLKVSSLKEVGEATFDYFYDREVEK